MSKMVVLNCDLVLKSVSQKGGGVRGSGKARDQSPGTLLRKLTHLNLPEKGIDHIVRSIYRFEVLYKKS